MDNNHQFTDAIASAGLVPPASFISDGKLHRFSSNGKPKDDSGWYILHGDYLPAGSFGCWRTGVSETWRADIGRALSPDEQIFIRQRVQEQKREREAEEVSRKQEASERASLLWAEASPCEEHPYLNRKGIGAHGVRVQEGKLLVPMRDSSGTLHSLQTINPDGVKRYLSGGRVNGCYFSIGRPNGVLCIAEGFATGVSVYESTGNAVAVAFSAGNLLPVAEAMRARFPDIEIVLCADDDYETEGNPGLGKAREAALKVGGKLAIPVFGDDRPEKATDFNDLALHLGKNAVKACIARAELLAMPEVGQVVENALEGNCVGRIWPEPLPLPKLPPVPEFPVELLPNELQAWIGDAAERARFRPDFAAAASMVALGSVIGRKLGIRLKQFDDWTEYANVWGGLIGPPSALKSPALRAAMQSFKSLQVAADAENASELEEYELQLEAYKLRKDAKKKASVKALKVDATASIDLDNGSPPEQPVARTYWTSNVNEASLGVLLEQNPNGVLIERDELSSLMVSLDNDANADLRGMMLSGWSGSDGYRFNRIGRGVTYLPKFALSVIGGIQPGPLARYVRDAYSGERADGLLQRFQLLVWPEQEAFEYVDRYPDGPARKAASALFERLDAFDPDSIGCREGFGDGPPFIRLSETAQALFVHWYSRFMRERRELESGGGESAPIAAHFGKYPGLLGKLALILHVADGGQSREVSERTMLKALSWIEYLTPHARRVYHAVEHPETSAAELLLSRLKRGELPPSFKAWEISRKCWHGLNDREAVKKACRLLFEYGWLIEVDAGGASGGRPADPVYSVSPAVEVEA